MSETPLRIALIGFGEVGTRLAQGFTAAGVEVATFDILFDNSEAGANSREKARRMGITAGATAAAVAENAQIVISAVTASAAFDVASQAGRYLRPGQFFLDLNSVAP